MSNGNISFSRYVRVESGVIGSGAVRQRELIGRIFTTNVLCPADRPLEFDSANAVGQHFGFSSEEYARASLYFSWISPNITRATRISFARYTMAATAPQVFGSEPASVSAITTIGETNSIAFDINGTPYQAQNIAFDDTMIAYADIANAIQGALRSQYPDITMIADSTLTYDSQLGAFVFTGGDVGDATISPEQTPLNQLLGFDGNAVSANGTASLPPAEAISRADSISTNYASLLFMGPLTLEQHIENANTLNSIEPVSYIYCIGVTLSDANTWGGALSGISGVAMTLVNDSYDEMIPMIQVAATNYANRNATSSFMFRQFGSLVPKVFSDEDANTLDSLRINYIGRTQKAGQTYAFYQRGVMGGGATAPVDQNVYANEIWLKDYAASQFMALLLGLGELPANETGETYGLNTLQGAIDLAVFNGVISVGKALNTTQQAAVTQLSGLDTAWRQVQNLGYWADVRIEEKNTTTTGLTEYELAYTLIYAKKDTIRSVSGRHALV